MSERVKIQVALDGQTGLPCLRAEGEKKYVALFPVTKLQVEQWVCDGGLVAEADADVVSFMLERLEMRGSLSAYNKNVKVLRRVAASHLTRENAASMLGTNLTLWEAQDDVRRPDTKFPTPRSEWGRVKDWLRGEVPDFEEWKRAENFFARCRTRDLVSEIWKLNLRWNSSVRQLVHCFYKTIANSEETGLPFMSGGVYELISQANSYVKLTATPQQSVRRPLVVGNSPIWPVLGVSNNLQWRPLLQQSLPIVGLRLWFKENHVKESHVEGNPNTIEVERLCRQTVSYVAAGEAPVTKGTAWKQLPPFRNRKNLPMVNRCPSCYEDVAPEIFRGEDVFWCYQVLDETGKLNRKHSRSKPNSVEGLHFHEPVDTRYLEVVRKHAERVRTVCLSGHTKTGKTTWLLSLSGITIYPAGKALHKVFPKSWKFDRIECSMSALMGKREAPNLLRDIDDMWVDGNVPTRNVEKNPALRCPVIFRLTPPSRFPWSNQREVVLIFNDIAGELVADAGRLIDHEKFRHLPATTDVVFLVPIDQINVADQLLGKFSQGLAAQTLGGKSLKLKDINLILAISQIDLLTDEHRPEEGPPLEGNKQEELRKILLSPPYTLPANQDEGALRAYFEGMRSVHHQLEEWLGEEAPLLVNAAAHYGSVRYCGFSSFGFQLIEQSMRVGSDFSLPFEPQPIRVADPLFWLLRENGMFNF